MASRGQRRQFMPKVSEFPHLAPTDATKVPVVGETHFLVGDLDTIFQRVSTVKIYRGIMYQAGTDEPVVAIPENTFGLDFNWLRVGDPGEYTCTVSSPVFSDPFKVVLSVFLVRTVPTLTFSATIARETDSRLRIVTFDGVSTADSVCGGTDRGLHIEVRVYP